jgi:hypothetical protein
VYSANEQDLIMGVVMKTEGKITINIDSLKRKAKELAPTMKADSDWDGTIAKLLTEVTVQAPAAAAIAAKAAQPPGAPPGAAPPPPATAGKPSQAAKDASKAPAGK